MAACNKSARSFKAGHSSGSAVSAAHARAKAEAVQVRASYATKEAQLKVDKAKIDAELQVLTLQREADAAVAEAQVLEEAEAIREEPESRKSLSEKVKFKHTSEYKQSQMVTQQSRRPQGLPTTSHPQVSSPNTFVTWHPPDEDHLEPLPIGSAPKLTMDNVAKYSMPNLSGCETKPKWENPNTPLSPFRSPFTPHYNTPASISHPAEPFAQYMARRDLITSGLYQFDDKPENYRAWFSSFTIALQVRFNLAPFKNWIS